MSAPKAPIVSDDNSTQRVENLPQHNSKIMSLLFPAGLNDDVRQQHYSGKGTHDNPFIIDYLQNDAQSAMSFSKGRKWTITVFQSFSIFAVTFGSSVYVGGIVTIEKDFHVSQEVAILGLSLYVLGFAFGPLLWAPLSELYGRRSIYAISFAAYMAFSVASAYAPNITALLLLRFFASAFGASSLTNSGGVITDMFSLAERGPPMGLIIMTPFLGPAFGPIVGGFLGETKGWRWILGLTAILSGVAWIATTLVTPETYAPFILRCRAQALSRTTGFVYTSRLDAGKPDKTLSQELSIALTRPWILLIFEPIVLLTSIYISIIYGTIYMFFAGFPIVFEISRGWNQGLAGLPFIGVAIGVIIATAVAGLDNKRFARLCAAAEANAGTVEPEARLRTAMVGSIVLPVGLFLFAWTTYPSVHWIVPIIGGMIFACGLVMVFISLTSYLIDSYVVYAASVMAASTVVRSLLAAAFPLFTTQMYQNLGDQWASSVPAFLVLGCLPFPFLFWKYGPQIRSKCKYASEAKEMLEKMQHPQDISMPIPVRDEPATPKAEGEEMV